MQQLPMETDIANTVMENWCSSEEKTLIYSGIDATILSRVMKKMRSTMIII